MTSMTLAVEGIPGSVATQETDLYLPSHYLNQQSQIYAYIFWALLFLFLLLSKTSWQASPWRNSVSLVKRWATRRRGRVSFRASSDPSSPKFFPSNGAILLLFVLFAILACLSLIGPDYIPGPTYTTGVPSLGSTVQKSLWTSAARAGLVASFLLPLVVLLALKSSPAAIFSWKFTTRLYFDKLALFHRWAAWFLYFFTVVHVVMWTIKLCRDRVGQKEDLAIKVAFTKDRFICGWVAFGLLTILVATSIPAFRKVHYDAFYALHVFLFPLTLVMVGFHHPETAWWAWLALSLWLFERVWRSSWILYLNYGHAIPLLNRSSSQRHMSSTSLKTDLLYSPIKPTARYQPPPGYVHAELLTGATIRLTYTSSRRIRWAPGQHFLINVPAISRFTSHPFTCVSDPQDITPGEDRSQLVFLIRAKTGWTKDLWDTVASQSTKGTVWSDQDPNTCHTPTTFPLPAFGLVMKMNVDGPFGSSIRIPWEHYSSVLLVVGGSGVTFGLSILEHVSRLIAEQDISPEPEGGLALRRVRFIWLIRDFGHLQWCASTIRRCKLRLPDDRLRIDIFVTKVSIGRPISESMGTASLDVATEKVPPLKTTVLHTRDFNAGTGIPQESSSSEMQDVNIDRDRMESWWNSLFPNPDEPATQFRSRDLTEFEGDRKVMLPPGELSLSQIIRRGAWHKPIHTNLSALPGEDVYDSAKVCLDREELKDVSAIARYARPGKPQMVRIVQYELEETSSSLLVACCGPVSLDVLVRQCIASDQVADAGKREQKAVSYYSEEFDY
ncbi:ferric reductase like transmembrane component-domain-containing protein [Ephemerocybe angulata]|uniref:Ferric reductase like transmembrane component-domain-containing protein n=1 Tax=Ephemerocybe angulata TaxID=980116 RepID=A0A8H6IGJ7_9AGAR|nr:ferric reductase like transmembrane component-domain-containing protein [Tulosesus angulatus]